MLKAAGPHIGFRFDHVISVQQAGYFKPHWKTYAKAAEIIGEERSSILFVAPIMLSTASGQNRTACERHSSIAVSGRSAARRTNPIWWWRISPSWRTG
jgi:hypothetical protein